MERAQEGGMKQPGVLVLGETKYFLKAESVAIEIKVSCCAEAMAFLCALYYAFQYSYPDHLHIVFGFFEKLLEIPKPSVKAPATISSFMTRVNGVIFSSTVISDELCNVWKKIHKWLSQHFVSYSYVYKPIVRALFSLLYTIRFNLIKHNVI